jgi:hypothetical protein
MKKILLVLSICFAGSALAQPPTDTTKVDFDSLLSLGDSGKAVEKSIVNYTFKSSRIVNGQSIEIVKPKHLEFRISHRFGSVRDGLYGFFGLDNAVTRLGLEYGINKYMMVGLGRSTYQKSIDAFYKAKVLQQREHGSPISISLFGSAVISTLKNNIANYRFDSRLNYTFQALIASKISERLSLQLSPTLVHRNLVPTKTYPNDLIAIGVGGRLKVSKRVSLNAEYFYRLLSKEYRAIDPYYNSLSVGFDIDTGGHIFSLHFTNSRPQSEPGFIGETTQSWLKGNFSFGFNITRQFYLGKKDKNLGW